MRLHAKTYILFIFLNFQVFATSYLYVTSIAQQSISSYKINNDGSLKKMKQYILPDQPVDMGTYDNPNKGNKFIFLAYYNINKVGVFRVNENGDLGVVSEYNTPIQPDPISSVINDKYLYINSVSEAVMTGYNFNNVSGELTPLIGSTKKIRFGGGWGYGLSPNGRYIYQQHLYNNSISALPINADGTLGEENLPIKTGVNPFHYVIYNGYLYSLSLDSNGVSKYKLTDDGGGFIPYNYYTDLAIDYKFSFVPQRMVLNKNYLYITDLSNNLNIFLIESNHNLKSIGSINCRGVMGRSPVFTFQGYAYQPVMDSNKIVQYKVDESTGLLFYLNSFPVDARPFHIAIFNFP